MGEILDTPSKDELIDIKDAFVKLAEDRKKRKKERMKAFGALLKSFRIRRQLTLEKACDAEHLLMCVNTLKSYENGIAEPGLEDLVKFSKFYRVSVDELIGLKDNIVDYDYEPVGFAIERAEMMGELFKITNYADGNDLIERCIEVLQQYIKTEDDKYLFLRGKEKNKNFGIKKKK